MAHRSMRMLVYLSCLFTCQLRDLSRNFPRRTPPTDNWFFLELKILITAISENSSFLAKSLPGMDCPYPIRILVFFEMIRPYHVVIPI